MLPRTFVPPAFVASVFAAAVVSPFWVAGEMLLLSVCGAYGMVTAAVSGRMILSQRRVALMLLPLAFFILHTAYGIGFWKGMVVFRRRWKDRGTASAQ